MADRAHVTSIEVLEAFRASLVVYLEKAGMVLDEVGEEVTRTRLWLQSDARMNCAREIKECTRRLNDAEQALFSSRLSASREPSTVERQAVNRARRALRDAQDKARVIKKWNQRFDSEVEPLAKKVEKLRFLLDHDMGKALTWLNNATAALEAYAELGRIGAAPRDTPQEAEAPSAAEDMPPPDDEDETRIEDEEEHEREDEDEVRVS